MSLLARVKAAEESRTITLSNGWKLRVRDLLPADFLSGPAAGDVAAWLSFNRADLNALQMMQEDGPDAEYVRAQWQEEIQHRRADAEIQARAARLHAAALLASVVGMEDPLDPKKGMEPVTLVDGDDVLLPGDPPVVVKLGLRTFAALLGPAVYVEAADILLLRAVGGEAGQKAALAFRDLRRTLIAGQAGKGLRVPTVGSDPGVDPGPAGGPDLLAGEGGGAGEAGA
jgi:hypothetical protein